MGRDHIFKRVIPIMILTIIITTSLMVCWAEDNLPQKIESGNRQSKSIDGDDYIDPTQPTSKLPIDGDDYIDPSTLEDLNSQ